MSGLGPLFSNYELGAPYDEMFDAARPAPRRIARRSSRTCCAASQAELGQRQMEADKAFLTQGITFTVYGDDQGTERIFPFDLLPRIITARGVARRSSAAWRSGSRRSTCS